MWQEIVTLAETIQWADAKTRRHAIGSAHYGYRLFDIYRNLMYVDDAIVKEDKEAMKKWIQAYDNAWKVYDKLPQQYPELATLYTQKYKRHIRGDVQGRLRTLKKQLKINE